MREIWTQRTAALAFGLLLAAAGTTSCRDAADPAAPNETVARRLPSELRIVFGGQVVGPPGDEVRVAVRVFDADIRPMQEVSVRYQVAQGSGGVRPPGEESVGASAIVSSDADGVALVIWRLGEEEGEERLEAHALFADSVSAGPIDLVARVIAEPPPGAGFGAEQFAAIPAGSFQMGCAEGEPDELPVHGVTISRAFRLQRTPVTQGQWQSVMGWNPSNFRDCGEYCPVERVSWDDAQEFLRVLNRMYPGRNFRLPSEAEWEYAARAGTTGDYGGTGVLDEMAWYRENSDARTQPVAGKLPNAWGLFDMHGNVWEWVQDWYSSGYYLVSPTIDPPGPASGFTRVMRGGSWWYPAPDLRSARRYHMHPDDRNADFGFRLVRGGF